MTLSSYLVIFFPSQKKNLAIFLCSKTQVLCRASNWLLFHKCMESTTNMQLEDNSEEISSTPPTGQNPPPMMPTEDDEREENSSHDGTNLVTFILLLYY